MPVSTPRGPDHTTLSRRSQWLEVGVEVVPANGPVPLIVDSTGLSIVGEGEWASANTACVAEWYEIVGVVDDFPGLPRMKLGSVGEPTIYHPAAPGDFDPAVLTVRYTGSIAADAAERLRAIAAGVDPSLQLRRIKPLSAFYDELRSVWHSMAWAVGFVTLTVLLLSAAGMQAVMSFAVAQRTREIGIRAALGAPPRKLLLGIFARALRQIGVGVLAGTLLSIGVLIAAGSSVTAAAALLATVAVVMTLVASLAALAPARRSLRMQTVDALRMEG